MSYRVELERESEGWWTADVFELPGAAAGGRTREEALARVQALVLRLLADRLESGELPALQLNEIFRVK